MSEQLNQAVKQAIRAYFEKLDGSDATNIYELVLQQIEQPLLEAVMLEAKHNQSQAALWLGLSRNTLRKLLVKYNLAKITS